MNTFVQAGLVNLAFTQGIDSPILSDELDTITGFIARNFDSFTTVGGIYSSSSFNQENTPYSGAVFKITSITGNDPAGSPNKEVCGRAIYYPTNSDVNDGKWRIGTGGSNDFIEFENIAQRKLPEHYGALGDGNAVSGIFSGTDDTKALQAWLESGLEYYAIESKVYMAQGESLVLPNYMDATPYLMSKILIAFSGGGTAWGVCDYFYYNNQAAVMRGFKGTGELALYGNDYVDNGFIGLMYNAECRIRSVRCNGTGTIFTVFRRDGATKVTSSAVDNIINISGTNHNGGIGFRSIDPDGNKITDITIVSDVMHQNSGYDVQLDNGAGAKISITRNYGSGGGVRVLKGSAATEIYLGQCDSGSASPSGTSGFAVYVDNVLTSESFDQAPGFVTVRGQINYPVSVGGLSSGMGKRGLDLQGVVFASSNGYALLPNTTNPAVTMLVRNCILSYQSFSSVFGTTSCPLRHVATSSLARFIVCNTLDKANNSLVNDIVYDGGGTPNITVSAGTVTIDGFGHYRVKAETGTADDITTINGVSPGAIVTFSLGDGTHAITFKDGSGNLQMTGDFALDAGADTIGFKKIVDGGNLLELFRSNNG